ncbi:chymotrypsinogen B-like [Hydractinia symbiolongicarpus]|uniref:chymotrypsinogen B-like n=1 Tax=Hydractinia symbiolongicarpus TaxID=13093 RepID=UPI00254B89A6|nr:chymotrypsinogen B-like [Hydractinia symbiolongicarpus]
MNFFIIVVLCFVAVKAENPFPCEDATWQCITWKKYCNDPMNKVYMEMNCKRTCELCPKCEDKSRFCSSRRSFCNDASNIDYMMKNCPHTCGFCTVPTTTPPPPPTPSWKVIPAGQCGVPKIQTSRVINGVDAKRGSWPWQILIRFMGQPHCGGSIISPFWIVTAAHCVSGKEDLKKEFKVIVGDHDFNQNEGSEVELGVSEIFAHERYHRSTLDYDIALIKLNRPVPFDNQYISSVCLPTKDEVLSVGATCYITGWGKIMPFDVMHNVLQQAKLPVVENTKCRALNTNSTNIPVTPRMLCAGHGPLNPTGGCHGDSGGPFVCQTGAGGSWVLHGAVSWGSGSCSSAEAYTVFARISYLRDWIDNKMATN